MTTDELIRYIKAMAENKSALERLLLSETVVKLNELEKNITDITVKMRQQTAITDTDVKILEEHIGAFKKLAE